MISRTVYKNIRFQRGGDPKKSLDIGIDALLKKYKIEILENDGPLPDILFAKSSGRIFMRDLTIDNSDISLIKKREANAIIIAYNNYFIISKCRWSGFYIKYGIYPIEMLEGTKLLLIKIAKEFANEL